MLNFLSKNAIALASLCVAVVSLVVAYNSLHYAVGAQKLDAEYKELTIRPNLQLEANTLTYSIDLINNGLGPAVIKRLIIADGERCLDHQKYLDEKTVDADEKFFDDAQIAF